MRKELLNKAQNAIVTATAFWSELVTDYAKRVERLEEERDGLQAMIVRQRGPDAKRPPDVDINREGEAEELEVRIVDYVLMHLREARHEYKHSLVDFENQCPDEWSVMREKMEATVRKEIDDDAR